MIQEEVVPPLLSRMSNADIAREYLINRGRAGQEEEKNAIPVPSDGEEEVKQPAEVAPVVAPPAQVIIKMGMPGYNSNFDMKYPTLKNYIASGGKKKQDSPII